MTIKTLSEQDFSNFVAQHSCNNFLQSIPMSHRYADNGTPHSLLGYYEKDTLKIAFLARNTKSRFGQIMKISGGPITDYDATDINKTFKNFLAELKNYTKSQHIIAVQFSPNIISETRDNEGQITAGPTHLEFKKFLVANKCKYLGEYENAKWLYVIPTQDTDSDTLFRNLRRNHQRLIKRAKSTPVTIRDLPLEELQTLKNIAGAAGERHGFHDPSITYYQEMKKAFGDQVYFRVAEIPGNLADPQSDQPVPIMAGMFIHYGDEIVCPYSGSIREYQRYGGAHLVHFGLIEDCLAAKVSQYNLYGTPPLADSGMYQFKTGFNGHFVELLGTFLFPVSFMGRLYALTKHSTIYGKLQ